MAFERAGTPREPKGGEATSASGYDIVMFGLGRFGLAIAGRLQSQGRYVLGVDRNPLALRRARELGVDAVYGDGTDHEFVQSLPLASAEWVVSTVPLHHTGLSEEDSRRTLIQLVQQVGFSGRLAVAAHNAADREALLETGADLVIDPFQGAADHAVELLAGTRAAADPPGPGSNIASDRAADPRPNG